MDGLGIVKMQLQKVFYLERDIKLLCLFQMYFLVKRFLIKFENLFLFIYAHISIKCTYDYWKYCAIEKLRIPINLLLCVPYDFFFHFLEHIHKNASNDSWTMLLLTLRPHTHKIISYIKTSYFNSFVYLTSKNLIP